MNRSFYETFLRVLIIMSSTVLASTVGIIVMKGIITPMEYEQTIESIAPVVE